MIKKLYAVFDKVALVYGNPFLSVNDGLAIRSFHHACKDPNTDLHQNPIDFSLMLIGSYDDETGVITSQNPAVIANGFIKE